MEIRELTEPDLSDLLQLYGHLHAGDEPIPSHTNVAAVWDSIQKNSAWKYFGVFIEGRLVASCTLSVIPNLTRGCRPYGVVENVVTHSDFRRQGHGRAILQHALSFAWQANCYKVMLMTGRKDAGTFAFYESSGFDQNEKQAFVAKPGRAEQTAARDRVKKRGA